MSQSPAKEDEKDQENKIVRSAEPTAAAFTEPPALEMRDLVSVPARTNLPVPAPTTKGMSVRRRSLWVALALAVVVGGAGGAFYWWQTFQSQLPPGIASGNGRIDVDEIDIDTKFAGPIAEILADEGDMVKAGEIVARMDTQDLAAALKKAEAQVQQARRAVDEANANVAQQSTQVLLAKQEIDRAIELVKEGYQTKEVLDQRQQQLDGANAALKAAQARMTEAQHALEASTHDVELYKVNIADNTLVAPKDGRIQYRIANTGEVLPAGGKVFTMLDISYVYMDIYLPTEEAGRVKIGADARIVLDAHPNIAIPAKVLFISAQAQFTAKIAETQSDRYLLMFRIRVKIDPEQVRALQLDPAAAWGLPGVAYLLLDPTVAWPPWLQGHAAASDPTREAAVGLGGFRQRSLTPV
jgi:HlyD family secretion protein